VSIACGKYAVLEHVKVFVHLTRPHVHMPKACARSCSNRSKATATSQPPNVGSAKSDPTISILQHTIHAVNCSKLEQAVSICSLLPTKCFGSIYRSIYSSATLPRSPTVIRKHESVTLSCTSALGTAHRLVAFQHSMDHRNAFTINPQDVELLNQSDGFKILRDHLTDSYCYRQVVPSFDIQRRANTYADSFCATHSNNRAYPPSHWLLARDVLHALLVPVVELLDKAVYLAAAVTRAADCEDLEQAFTDQAHGAFRWLQCLLSSGKERQWCYAKGCPACVVQASLDSEFSIRMLYAACLLSDVHYPFTLDGPRLPSFRFFLSSLQNALCADPRYGAEYFELMQPKALATRNGIEELILQCVELETVLTDLAAASEPQSEASSPRTSPESSPVLQALGASSAISQEPARSRRGRSVSRKMSLQVDDDEWEIEMSKRCWDRLPTTAQNSITVPTQYSDLALKHEPMVTVIPIKIPG